MKNKTFEPLGNRAFGFADERRRFLKSLQTVVSEAVAALLVTAFFMLLVYIALLDPFGVSAPPAEDERRVIGSNHPRAVGGPENDETEMEMKISNETIDNQNADFAAADEHASLLTPTTGELTSGFGYRRNPFNAENSEFHAGQDISAPHGAEVVAAADGTVTFSGWLKGYGLVIYIKHGEAFVTRYAHLSRRAVEIGDRVRQGDKIGEVGSTGRSTGAHLHYEVRIRDVAVNPLPFLQRGRN